MMKEKENLSIEELKKVLENANKNAEAIFKIFPTWFTKNQLLKRSKFNHEHLVQLLQTLSVFGFILTKNEKGKQWFSIVLLKEKRVENIKTLIKYKEMEKDIIEHDIKNYNSILNLL